MNYNAQQLAETTNAILLIRHWEEENLPLDGSKLVYDLLTLCVHYYASDVPLTIKHLNLLLSQYSQAGIRNQLRRCVRDGWLKIIASDSDKRSRLIVVEHKLLCSMQKYVELLRDSHAQSN